jgi:glutaminyl-peptide cyclotransferase
MTRSAHTRGWWVRQAGLLLLLALAGCGRSEKKADLVPLAPGQFDGERALYEVHRLVALGARDAGTPGAERAALHIQSRLKALGVEATLDTFQQPTPRGERTFHNVIGRIPGTQPGLILLGSHFDTKSGIAPDFQGANDSGSSTGVLLELARLLALHGSPGPEIHLLFFDGEEAVDHYSEMDGLHGSRHHAQRMVDEGRAREVRAMVLLDMIGDRDLSVTVPRNVTRELAIALLRAADAEGQRAKFVLFPFEVGDDHEPFLRRGMPALNIIDFQYGSGPGRNDYWHTRLDTLDKISAESLGLIGRVTIRIVQDVSAQPVR